MMTQFTDVFMYYQTSSGLPISFNHNLTCLGKAQAFCCWKIPLKMLPGIWLVNNTVTWTNFISIAICNIIVWLKWFHGQLNDLLCSRVHRLFHVQAKFRDSWLRYLLWNCPNMNVTGLHLWSVNIGSGDGLVPSGSKPLPEPVLTQISVDHRFQSNKPSLILSQTPLDTYSFPYTKYFLWTWIWIGRTHCSIWMLQLDRIIMWSNITKKKAMQWPS